MKKQFSKSIFFRRKKFVSTTFLPSNKIVTLFNYYLSNTYVVCQVETVQQNVLISFHQLNFEPVLFISNRNKNTIFNLLMCTLHKKIYSFFHRIKFIFSRTLCFCWKERIIEEGSEKQRVRGKEGEYFNKWKKFSDVNCSIKASHKMKPIIIWKEGSH